MKKLCAEIYDEELSCVGRTFKVHGDYFEWEGQKYRILNDGQLMMKTRYGWAMTFATAVIIEVED